MEVKKKERQSERRAALIILYLRKSKEENDFKVQSYEKRGNLGSTHLMPQNVRVIEGVSVREEVGGSETEGGSSEQVLLGDGYMDKLVSQK